MNELDALYEIAWDEEITTLDTLAVRAGLRWKCSACSWMNVTEDAACDNCGAKR